MRKITEIFFGRKVHLNDEKVGILSARIKSTHPEKSYIWTSENKLESQKKETVFLFEGNSNGPSESHLKCAYRIIEEIEDIKKNVDITLKKDPTNYKDFRNWKNDFYFSAMTPFDNSRNEFEINFEPCDQDDTKYITLIWANGKLTEIEGNKR